MIIGIAYLVFVPVNKLTGLLKRCSCTLDKVGLRYTNLGQGTSHCRPRAFTNPDGMNGIRLNDSNSQFITVFIGFTVRGSKEACSKPTCSAATNDNYPINLRHTIKE